MSGYRTNSGLADDLLVELRRDAPEPLHGQLGTAVRDAIRQGRLRAGASLPSTRRLAAELGVSRGVVVEAYQQLVAEGYLTSRAGGYTRVAATGAAGASGDGARSDLGPRPGTGGRPTTRRSAGPSVTAHATAGATAGPRIDFRYCQPDVSQFPRAAWLRSLRRAVHEAPDDRLIYPDARGVPELHQALAGYLNRARGCSARPGNVVVCSGYTQGLALVCQVLAAGGARRVAVEDPSDDEIRQIPLDAGLEVVGVPVGEDGLRVDRLQDVDADALLLTPAHQCPTGAVLPAPARAAVLDWARRRGALVVEDDYDTEYRYDRAPIGAMQGLAPDHVVYAGSASKTLAPGLRLGWMVAPDRLVGPLTTAKKAADRGSPALDQMAFADFLARGELARHMRRMQPVYRRRRDALLAALADRVPELRPAGISAGLHLAVWLPPDLDEPSVVAAAACRGLGVYGIERYRLDGPGEPGLLFGYASLTEEAIAQGIDILAEVIAALRADATAAARVPTGL
jgi:GntR family transcriptional regulator/MocR family aminotransferase